MEDIEVSLTLDVLSFHCPIPVHETKRALVSMGSGEVLLVMADDPEIEKRRADLFEAVKILEQANASIYKAMSRR